MPINSQGKRQKWHSDAKKIEAVTTYLVLGKSNLVAAAIGVPEGTVRQWKTQPWWSELTLQIQTESDQELDAKLQKRIDKSLDLINDRLNNGDFQYDPKTGEFIRRPIGARDLWKMTSEMVDKRWIIRKLPKEQSSQEAVGDILKNLAKEFAVMAKRRVKDGEVNVAPQADAPGLLEDGPESLEAELPVGVPELPLEAGTDQESIPTQPSTVPAGE